MSKYPDFGPVTTPMEQIDAALARAKAAEAAAAAKALQPAKPPASGRRRRVVQALEELKKRNRAGARG